MPDEITPDPTDVTPDPADVDPQASDDDVEAHGIEEEDDSEAAQFNINCGCA